MYLGVSAWNETPFASFSWWLDMTRFHSSGCEKFQNSGCKGSDICVQLLAHAFKCGSVPLLPSVCCPDGGRRGASAGHALGWPTNKAEGA